MSNLKKGKKRFGKLQGKYRFVSVHDIAVYGNDTLQTPCLPWPLRLLVLLTSISIRLGVKNVKPFYSKLNHMIIAPSVGKS
jgi:hypothetical protein